MGFGLLQLLFEPLFPVIFPLYGGLPVLSLLLEHFPPTCYIFDPELDGQLKPSEQLPQGQRVIIHVLDVDATNIPLEEFHPLIDLELALFLTVRTVLIHMVVNRGHIVRQEVFLDLPPVEHVCVFDRRFLPSEPQQIENSLKYPGEAHYMHLAELLALFLPKFRHQWYVFFLRRVVIVHLKRSILPLLLLELHGGIGSPEPLCVLAKNNLFPQRGSIISVQFVLALLMLNGVLSNNTLLHYLLNFFIILLGVFLLILSIEWHRSNFVVNVHCQVQLLPLRPLVLKHLNSF